MFPIPKRIGEFSVLFGIIIELVMTKHIGFNSVSLSGGPGERSGEAC
jgi:hypothetical protein